MSKQVIVVRKDLNMPYGKFGAQVSHASMGAFFESINVNFRDYKNKDIDLHISVEKKTAIHNFLTGSFVKIILEVPNEKELINIFNKAKENKIPVTKIIDEGRTVFKEPTLTCVGIGPFKSNEIDKITGNLKLYR